MTVQIIIGDVRERLRDLPDESVNCCVTSPPYFGLRDYGVAAQIGLEASPDAFIEQLVGVFREVRRALRPDGTLWLNIGDSYASNAGGYSSTGSRGATSSPTIGAKTMAAVQKGRGRKPFEGCKEKDLIGIPWMLAFALRADGWFLRQDIIWSKPNPMPESVRDRCTKAHEYLFLLSKSPRYFYDADAIKEASVDPDGSARRYESEFGGAKARAPIGKAGIDTRTRPQGMREFDGRRNKRSVWEVATQPFKEAHFATFPPALVEPCILAGCPVGGLVLDPFGGAGTTGLVAQRLGRRAVLVELNPEYAAIADRRIRAGDVGLPLGAAA